MKIDRLWFANNRIYVTNDKGETLYQSLKFYPRLLMATDEERAGFKFGHYGIHWEEIDEDISYESFYYEDMKEPTTGLQDAFLSHPEINTSALAHRMGIQQSFLASYIKGTKTPSQDHRQLILQTIHDIGKSLLSVNF